MSTKKTASKSATKANISIKKTNLTKKQTNKVNKTIKKLGTGFAFVLVFVLALGAIGGWFGFKYLMRDDCFELVGSDEITLTINEVYHDEGVNVVAFGHDDSDKINIKTNLTKKDGGYTSNEVGTFYIEYEVNNLKYGSLFKIKKVRLISFVEPSEDTVEATDED